MKERLHELLLAWEEDALSPAEVEELAELIERDEPSRQAAIAHFSLSSAIAEQLRVARYEESAIQELRAIALEPRRREPGTSFSAWAAALLVLIALLGAGYYFDLPKTVATWWAEPAAEANESALVVAIFGDVRTSEKDSLKTVAVGSRLRPGESLDTLANGHATIRFDDGTTLKLRSETRLALESSGPGKRLTLERGGLYAVVSSQPAGKPLVINPGRYDQVEVLGTQFEMERRPAAESVLRVETGQVNFGVAKRAVQVVKEQESRVSSQGPAPAAPQAFDLGEIWRGWDGGLTGEYFRWEGLSGPHITRIDPTIDFDWGQGSPDPSINGSFSVRWTGEIEAPHSGEFTFHTTAHYGVRLWVNGQSLIRSDASMGGRESSRSLTLKAGQHYPIKIEYFDKHGHARMHLRWSSPAMPETVIQQQWLHPVAAEKAAIPKRKA